MSLTASDLLTAPVSPESEWRVLAALLTTPERIPEMIGVPLEQEDFSSADTRVIFSAIVERHFAGKPIDALIVAETIRAELVQFWSAESSHVGALMEKRTRDALGSDENLAEHAALLKRLSTQRKLRIIGQRLLADIAEGKQDPAVVADKASTAMLQATAGSIRRSELLDWMDVGRDYVRQLRQVQAATASGQDIGVMTGLSFVDDHTAGIAPGELAFLASEAGAGKTALAWACALGFAARQMRRGDERVGTLMLSMEMGLYGSTMRVVANLTGIHGTRLRRGGINAAEYSKVLREWKLREDLPIWWNFASSLKVSQARALIAEAIRKHNTGFVVIDHFRMLEADEHFSNGLEADEAKVRMLKNIAKDLNVAVMCLAHTVKARAEGDGRPRLSDLRGSGMITAFADQVAFIWTPANYMSEEDARRAYLTKSDMSIEWSKNRFGSPAEDGYIMVPETMRVFPKQP